MNSIVLASDHAGYKLKEEIKKFLIKKKNKNQFGILICGSGIGMDMAANKHKNIRAALCYNIKYHNAFNGGEENRVHLVACLTDYKFH